MLEEYLWENGHVCAYKGLQGGGKEMWWMKPFRKENSAMIKKNHRKDFF